MIYFEKIKSMNFEEMAKFFRNLELCATEQIAGFSPNCSRCPYGSLDGCPTTDSIKWLESEVEE